MDELFRKAVARARQMSADEKMRAGGDMFDELCERMRAGIRFQFPEADNQRVEQILEERLRLARRLEACG